jgi:hypothetical protein
MRRWGVAAIVAVGVGLSQMSIRLRHPPWLRSRSYHTGSSDHDRVRDADGEKDHWERCRQLSRSRMPMMLAEAARRDGPCSVCTPPGAP